VSSRISIGSSPGDKSSGSSKDRKGGITVMKQTQQKQAPRTQQQTGVPPPQTSHGVAITKRDAGALAEVPEYLRRPPGQGAAGFDEVEQGDLTLPRLALCQALTPQRDETEPKHIEGLEEGEYFNTLTGENYGNLVQIVPLLFFKNRIYFRSKDEGGGILCRSDDMKHGVGDPGGECAKCPLNRFGTAKNGKGKGKACTEFYNFPSLIVAEDGRVHPEGMVVASFKSSGVPAAKDWLAKMRLRQIDMFGGVYSLSSKKKKFPEGTAFVTNVDPAGNVSLETYQGAKQAHEAMASLRRLGRLQVDVADLEPNGDEPGADDGEGKPPF